MLVIYHYQENKPPMEFNNGKELKEMLQFCNPMWLNFYKKQIEKNYDFLKIEDCGVGVRVVRLDLRDE